MAHAELATGLGMQPGAVAGAVVGEHPLDRDPHALEPGDRPPQEPRGGGALLVGQDLDVGEAGGVVDADVDELPAGGAQALGPDPLLTLASPGAEDAMAGAPAADPPQLLDVDVDQLARPLALVAVGRLGRLEAAALAETDPRQPPGDRRERHPQDLGDSAAVI